jgi:hypothetical protein
MLWRKLRAVLQGQPTMMLRFVRETYEDDAFDEAWDEFTLYDDDDPRFDPDTPHMEVFLPWFYHRWQPAPAETSITDVALHDRTPTRVLLERRGGRLDPLLRRYLEACTETPFSFYEVLRCEPGRGFRARDLLTGAEVEVLDRSASRTLEQGDAFFGQLVTVDGVTVIESMGRHAVPLRHKLAIIDFRERVAKGSPFSVEMLEEWDMELRSQYLEIMDDVLNPRPPRLQNTDGEEIAFHRLAFEIDSAPDAFAALKDLAPGETEEDLLAEAELGPEGDVRRVSFAWRVTGNAIHESWDNTVLGHIDIDVRELRASVNSAERAARLRALLEARLGAAIRHRSTDIESMDDALAERGPAPANVPSPSLADDPEVRARIQELVRAHYESWVSEPVPALGGVTPLEAVQDRVGREKVEALIRDMERKSLNSDLQVDEGIFASLRKRLGLV